MGPAHEVFMSPFTSVAQLVRWSPLQPGEPAPKLSLTADEGTWIRLPDFKGHINVLLVFFRSMSDDATDAWLKDIQRNRQRFEDLETAVFGVSTARTDKLREYRSSLGLEFFLLYDPLAVDSRAFRCSGRLRPVIKDNVVLVGKDGLVVEAWRGQPNAETLLAAVARAQGVTLEPVAPVTSAPSEVRSPGKPAAEVKHVDAPAAVALLKAKDSPYLLLDVRTLSEFEADHAPGAIHVPVDELPHRYQELGQTSHIICLCQAGSRSAAAAEFLTSIGGTHIVNVLGGMSSWSGDRITGGRATP
jgi:rhodanese-related sulfurtransferase/peroxiredoxin